LNCRVRSAVTARLVLAGRVRLWLATSDKGSYV
jgi:hypothetical protein